MPYRLTRQLHFKAHVAGRTEDVIVTMQRWDSLSSRPSSVCVTLYDGVEQSRRIFRSEDDLAHLQAHLDRVAADRRADALSEEGAEDTVVRRGGPKLGFCHRKDCGSPVPWAAATCADGHPTESVGGVEYLSVTQRRPVIVPVTGGRR
jgi:hypothetical protein